MAIIALLIHVSAFQAILPTGSFYELTRHTLPRRDQFPPLPPWTSVNTTVFGAKIGDRTIKFDRFFGQLDYTRTLENEYLTVYCENSLFVYTNKADGKLIRFELFEGFAKFIADPSLKKLLTNGDLETMRDVLGTEDRMVINENEEDNTTAYVYDQRGIVFVRYLVGGKTTNALRLQ